MGLGQAPFLDFSTTNQWARLRSGKILCPQNFRDKLCHESSGAGALRSLRDVDEPQVLAPAPAFQIESLVLQSLQLLRFQLLVFL